MYQTTDIRGHIRDPSVLILMSETILLFVQEILNKPQWTEPKCTLPRAPCLVRDARRRKLTGRFSNESNDSLLYRRLSVSLTRRDTEYLDLMFKSTVPRNKFHPPRTGEARFRYKQVASHYQAH
jgi:hypothetical protein